MRIPVQLEIGSLVDKNFIASNFFACFCYKLAAVI